jgi:hypothetical protein
MLGVLTGALVVMLVSTILHVVAPASELHPGVFTVVLALALAYGMARTWSVAGGWRTVTKAALAAMGVAVITLGLHLGATQFPGPLPQPRPPQALLIFVGGIFAGLFLFQALLWRANRSALGRRLYVHALNGFYVGTWLNRLLGRLWPQQPVSA